MMGWTARFKSEDEKSGAWWRMMGCSSSMIAITASQAFAFYMSMGVV